MLRKAQTTVFGAAALLAVLTLVAAFGARSAKPAVKTAKGSSAASISAAPTTVAARANPVPFTRVDFVLLLTGGGMLLVVGSSIRRLRTEQAEKQ